MSGMSAVGSMSMPRSRCELSRHVMAAARRSAPWPHCGSNTMGRTRGNGRQSASACSGGVSNCCVPLREALLELLSTSSRLSRCSFCLRIKSCGKPPEPPRNVIVLNAEDCQAPKHFDPADIEDVKSLSRWNDRPRRCLRHRASELFVKDFAHG